MSPSTSQSYLQQQMGVLKPKKRPKGGETPGLRVHQQSTVYTLVPEVTRTEVGLSCLSTS